jgi:hypothetical protein
MMKKTKLVPEIIAVTSIIVLFFSLAQFVNASASTILPIDEPFNSAVPAPRVELGWEVGQWHARPEQISHYLERLAASSDRATIDIIGRTFEQRPLLQMIITSPENHSRLEQLRELHLKARGEGPLVISLGYSIHGNESSGSNAAMLLAYHLIAGDAQWVSDLLKDTIVIIDPMMNPDGLNRAANWFNMHRGEQPVANTLRRVEPRPNWRFNH